MFCEFNNPTWWERRRLIGNQRWNLLLLHFWWDRRDRPRRSRSYLDRSPKLRRGHGSLDSGCGMCSSHIWPARVGTNCKNIYGMRHCLDGKTLVVFGWALLAIFYPFLLPFLTWKFPLPNEHLVLFIAIRKKLKVCSIPWHKSCTGCGQRCRQRGYSHQMWHDFGRGLVKG